MKQSLKDKIRKLVPTRRYTAKELNRPLSPAVARINERIVLARCYEDLEIAARSGDHAKYKKLQKEFLRLTKETG